MDESSESEILFSNPEDQNIVVPSSQQIPYSGRNDTAEPELTTQQPFDQDSGASCLSEVDRTTYYQLQNQELIDTVLSFQKNLESDQWATLSRIEAVAYRTELTISSRDEERTVFFNFAIPSTYLESTNYVMSQTRTEVNGLALTLPEPMISSTSEIQSAQPHRIPLSLADRDQLRAMIVMLNESNSVLLKLRHRFPLSAPTRCDVIQRQIQIQLQELFGEFRRNDVEQLRSNIPQNREIFLIIWNQIAHLVTELCYHT